MRLFLLTLLSASFFFTAKAQRNDSAEVAKAFTELISLCKNVDFSDPKTTELGAFYKAAPFIVYRGDDKTRAWKVAANYSNETEQQGVNAACERVNQTVNQDKNYKIVQYFTEKESEGTWHVLTVLYQKKGIEKKAAFAFLKIGRQFLLGDID